MPLNFNSHAHVERDQSRPKRQSHRLYFNSHAHVERDAYVLEKDKFDNISTHTLTWSVTCKEKGFTIWICHFNSHAHVERDTLGAVLSQSRQQFQLTRSRGAWRLTRLVEWFLSIISTHTLTWSVTAVLSLIGTFIGFQLTRSRGAWPQKNSPKAVIKIISTHTLTWSVTGLWWNCRFLWQFQLTRSRGAWLLGDKVVNCSCLISTHTLTWSVTTADLKISADVFISTHTLTWSVTCRFFLCRLFICHFNSHAHVERDSLITFSYFNQFAFQLTRSRGAWRQHHNHSVYD